MYIADSSPNVLFFQSGWKLQYQPAAPYATLKQDVIFYGLGNCPYKKISPADLAKASTIDELVDFYMTVMKTECLTDKKKYVYELIQDGYLVQHEQHLLVPADLKYL